MINLDIKDEEHSKILFDSYYYWYYFEFIHHFIKKLENQEISKEVANDIINEIKEYPNKHKRKTKTPILHFIQSQCISDFFSHNLLDNIPYLDYIRKSYLDDESLEDYDNFFIGLSKGVLN